jgi:hypothetical protein
MKKEAKELGVTYKEMLAKESQVDVLLPKKGFKKSNKNDFEVVIKMKDEDGKV